MTRFSLMLVLAFSIACGTAAVREPAPPSQVTTEGDWVRGGALYDKWWKVAKVQAPAGNHPLWSTRPDQQTNQRTGPTTWRCKECHGWDYKGIAGAYAGGSHRTGFSGIRGAINKSTAVLTELIAQQHGYAAAGLSARDVRDLVAFIKKGQVETSDLITQKKFSGQPSAGAKIYQDGIGELASCADCHGEKGLEAVSNGFDDFPGKVGIKNPWELVHKIRFGQPGTDMPPYARQISTVQLKNLGAFIQTLPKTKPTASPATPAK